MVTINDIAKIVGVDKSTVSRALNDSERISKKVRRKIKKIAQDLNYYPNASAYSLRKKINRTIAVVFTKNNFPGGEFFQEVMRGIDSVIQKNFFTILFTTYTKDDNSFLRIVHENRVDGALIIGDVFKMEELQELDNVPIPTFIVNYRIDNHVKNLVDIYSDNEHGGKLVTEHLIKVHNRKNVLYIGGGNMYQANRLRLKGFKYITEKYNKDGNDIKAEVINGDFATSFKCGEDIIEELIRKKRFNFDGIFAASDSIAIGAYKGLLKHKIQVPEEVSMISYDNLEICPFFPVSLTSVDQTAHLVGRMAAAELMKKIMKKDSGLSKGIAIEPELVIRKSCGCNVNRC